MSEPEGQDRIHIRDLRVRCTVGLNDWEREKVQEVALSLTLYADLGRAGRSDRVEDSVDYRSIKRRVMELAEQSRFYLIERLAEAVADACLEDPRVNRVDVVVDKLGALRFASSVAIEITRRRPGRARASGKTAGR